MTTEPLADLAAARLAPAREELRSPVELTVLMPCLNEAETIGACIEKAQTFLRVHQVRGEVLIADNGSTDGSVEIAEKLGARVVRVAERGYGAALLGGMQVAAGEYVIMGDADDSYDFSNLGPFLDELRRGNDMVMGNRFTGGIEPGAMPPLHRYVGNPILSWLGRRMFEVPIHDFHCGLRGFRRSAILDLNLQTTGMEFASEMVVQASIRHLSITEVPTTLSRDGRSRAPHLRMWRDGWRHLRFLLLYSPNWLFLYPGFTLLVLGLALVVTGIADPMGHAHRSFELAALFGGSTLVFVGYQAVCFSLYTRVYAQSEGFLPPSDWIQNVCQRITLETGLLVGVVLLVVGATGFVCSLIVTTSSLVTASEVINRVRLMLPSALLLALGAETIFGSFFLSICGMGHRKPAPAVVPREEPTTARLVSSTPEPTPFPVMVVADEAGAQATPVEPVHP